MSDVLRMEIRFSSLAYLFYFVFAKLRKKLVKSNGFWKINAIRPKMKAKRRRMRKYENEGNAKYGGLVKELGFLFVTQI